MTVQSNIQTDSTKERWIYWFFRVSLSVKLFSGVFEALGALIVLFTPTGWWHRLAQFILDWERVYAPDSALAGWLANAADRFSVSTQWFVIWYLAIHALVKIALAAAVLKNKLWAYPWMIAVLCAFIVYQCYDIATTGSIPMIALTIFDVFIVYLTTHEWRRHKQRLLAD